LRKTYKNDSDECDGGLFQPSERHASLRLGLRARIGTRRL